MCLSLVFLILGNIFALLMKYLYKVSGTTSSNLRDPNYRLGKCKKRPFCNGPRDPRDVFVKKYLCPRKAYARKEPFLTNLNAIYAF